MEPPPGGPPDRTPPRLVGVSPSTDSSVVGPSFDGEAVFAFDETISEGGSPNFGTGTGGLERLVILSPATGVPVVKWKRNRITVRPREGWKPGRTYWIELLAGVTDLRSNSFRQTSTIVFTTDTVAPRHTLRGRLVDWTTSRPASRALVEAIRLPDSLVYRMTADSAGSFTAGPLPDGTYLVRGVLDQNRNLRWDRSESFDSIRVAAGVTEVGELWMFRHDSIGPRLVSVTPTDSLTLAATLDQPYDPTQPVIADSAVVRRTTDSSRVAVRGVVPTRVYDSLVRATRRPAAGAEAADTTPLVIRGGERRIPAVPGGAGGLTTKPPLEGRFMIQLAEPAHPGDRLIVDLFGVRNPNGAAGGGRALAVFPEAPKPPPRDTTATRDTSGAARRPPAGREGSPP